jgi:omega-amidase
LFRARKIKKEGMMEIGIVQLDMAWEDPDRNRKRIGEILHSRFGIKQLDWLIFPEMTLSGFSMDRAKTTLRDDDLRFFRSIAKEYSLNLTFGGVIGGYNLSITIDAGGKTISEYSKIHLFSFSDEDKHYTPGNLNSPFNVKGFRVNPYVCYDLRFPYIFWRNAAETDLYVVIASWPASRIAHWRALLQARSIENQAYVVGVNRTGTDPNVDYNGNSLVFDPLGMLLIDCGDAEGLFSCSIDIGNVMETRRHFPFQADRRE